MSSFTYTPLTRYTLGRAASVNTIIQAIQDWADTVPSAAAITNGTTSYSADGGAADAYVVTLDPAPASYVDGLLVSFKAANANTGASTVNVNALGLKQLRDYNGDQLTAGLINAGDIVTARYDGTVFRLTTLPPLANNAVTNAKLADMAEARIKGRAAGAGTGDPTDLAPSQVLSAVSASFDTRYARVDTANTLAGNQTISNTGPSLAFVETDQTGVGARYALSLASEAFGVFVTDEAGSNLAQIGQFNTPADALPSAFSFVTRSTGDNRYAAIASSVRFKPDAAPVGAVNLSGLVRHEWTWGGDLAEDDPRRGKLGSGLIAEDVAAVLPEAVTRDEQGRVTGLDPLTLIGALVAEVNALRARIETLEGE